MKKTLFAFLFIYLSYLNTSLAQTGEPLQLFHCQAQHLNTSRVDVTRDRIDIAMDTVGNISVLDLYNTGGYIAFNLIFEYLDPSNQVIHYLADQNRSLNSPSVFSYIEPGNSYYVRRALVQHVENGLYLQLEYVNKSYGSWQRLFYCQ